MKYLLVALQNLAKQSRKNAKPLSKIASVIIVRLAKAREREKPAHSAIISRASKQIKAKQSTKSSKKMLKIYQILQVRILGRCGYAS